MSGTHDTASRGPGRSRTADAPEVVAAVRGAVVRFGDITVLHGVDLALVAGEVHALVGQNGAGKSTLVKALTGVNPLAGGSIEVDGRPLTLRGPQDARRAGIEIVYQDQPLAPHLDVADNMFLGWAPRRGGVLLDRSAMRSLALEVLERVGADCEPHDLVDDLSPTQRVQVSIAAAMAARPRVLILDEPTAALGAAEAAPVFELVRAATDDGVAVLYISHRLSEISRLASRTSVLRDGRLVLSATAAELTTEQMIRAMVGRDLDSLFPDVPHELGEPLLEVDGLRSGELVRGIDLELRRGEIVGLAGLVGSGASESLLALFGARSSTGRVRLDGHDASAGSPRAAVRAGLALVPEERRTEAIFPGLSLASNLTAASLPQHSRLGVLSPRSETTAARALVDRLGIVAGSVDQDAATLSGGNQQKAVVGRWLARGGRVYLVDEPTAGVDVGAKVEIYTRLGELAADGAAVLVVSSDFDELVGVCDRILVVRDGTVHEDFARGTVTVEQLTSAAAATGSGPGAAGPVPGAAAAPPRLRPGLRLRQVGVPLAMVAVLAVLALGAPSFVAPGTLLDVVRQASTPALLAAALAIALGAGAFDLSVGATALLTATLSALLVQAGAPPALALVVGVVVGAAVGAVNGAVTVLLSVPTFVATLGMLFLLTGATLGINGGLTLGVPPDSSFLLLGRGWIGPLPVVALWALGVVAAVTVGWRSTPVGLAMRAVGDDAATAQLRGVPRGRTTLLALVTSGAISGLAGVLLASYSSGSTARDASLELLVSALAAAFLGSAMTRGFLFDPATAAVGALFVTAVGVGLISNGFSDQLLAGIQGLVLLLAVLVAVARRRRLGQVAIF